MDPNYLAQRQLDKVRAYVNVVSQPRIAIYPSLY